MLVHAAGESSPGNLPDSTFAIVLSVADEPELLRLSAQLEAAGIGHRLIREPDAPYVGQAMAIGVHPASRTQLRGALRFLRPYRGPR